MKKELKIDKRTKAYKKQQKLNLQLQTTAKRIMENSTYGALDKALRYNEGKRNWSLVNWKSLEPMVEVLEYGAKKYTTIKNGVTISGADNWKKGLDKKQILDSMMRHLTSLIDGEDIDSESNLKHTGHLFCNLMFYNYFNK